MPHDILVYSEYPASTGSLIPSLRAVFPGAAYPLHQIYQADIRNGILRQPDARILVLPGITGEDSLYTAQLDRAALDDIHHFVSTQKNVILTICAGTYFVCRETIYDPPWCNRKTKQSIRPLFNALAHGPVPPYGRKPLPSSQFGNISVAPIRFRGLDGQWHKTGICYGNGPGLYPDAPDDPDTEILAIYDSTANGQPAALIRQRIGAGALYLSSMHPENGWQNIRSGPGMAHIKTLMDELKPHEPGRLALWQDLAARMKRDIA